MTVTCPICSGSGQAPHHNGVDPQKPDLHICYMCKGVGTVIEEPIQNRLHIRKYWMPDVVE